MTKLSKGSSLSPIQQRFCDEYLIDFNATAAYARAGYQARGPSAAASAARLLTKPPVAQYLSSRRQELSSLAELSLERLVKEIKAIALADPRRMYDANGVMLPPNEWPDELAAAIAGIEVDEITEQVEGKRVCVGYTRKLKLWPKLEAIEKALKLLAAYPERKENAPMTAIVGVVVVPAKQPWQEKSRSAIAGQVSGMQRLEPEAPKTSTFHVHRVP